MSEKRNIVIVAKGGIVGVQSIDLNRYEIVNSNGRLVKKMNCKSQVLPYDETEMKGPAAAMATVANFLEIASTQKIYTGARLNFFTLTDAAYRGRELVSRICKDGMTAEAAVEDALAKSEARTGKPAPEGYADHLINLANAIAAAKGNDVFISFDDVTPITKRDLKTTTSGKIVNNGTANLQNVIAAAWDLCPKDEIDFVVGDQETAF